MVNKENDAKREKIKVIQKMNTMERERQHLAELNIQSENLKEANSFIRRENATLQDIISEQKVSLRCVDCIHFVINIKKKTRHPVFTRNDTIRLVCPRPPVEQHAKERLRSSKATNAA